MSTPSAPVPLLPPRIRLATCVGLISVICTGLVTFGIMSLLPCQHRVNGRTGDDVGLSDFGTTDSGGLRRLQYDQSRGVVSTVQATHPKFGVNPDLTEAEVAFVAELRHVHHLMFTTCGVSRERLLELVLTHQIQTVMFGEWVRDEHCESLSHCDSIKKIVISGGHVTQHGIDALSKIEQLQELTIASSLLGKDDAKGVQRRLPKVKLLILDQ